MLLRSREYRSIVLNQLFIAIILVFLVKISFGRSAVQTKLVCLWCASLDDSQPTDHFSIDDSAI